jgi:hypothetical protein
MTTMIEVIPKQGKIRQQNSGLLVQCQRLVGQEPPP